MATTTARLGLRKPAGTDTYNVTTDLDNSLDSIDNAVGFQTCTSSTHPSSPYTGKPIYETDTQNELFYDGSNWKYMAGAILCTSGARPAATALVKGDVIVETDTGNALVWLGAAWQHLGVPVLGSSAAFQSAYFGAQYMNNADGWRYTCSNATGPVWDAAEPWYPGFKTCRYVRSGTSQSITSAGSKVAFDGTAISTCPWVTASGTGNTDFTVSKSGVIDVSWGFRYAASTVSALHNTYTALRRGTTELSGDNTMYNFGTTAEFPVLNGAITGLAVANGDSFNLWVIPDVTISAQQAGTDIFISLSWRGV